MALAALDHVTLHTARLGELTDFYAKALGLRPGKRPPFGFDGAWLYCDGHAALHLVEVADSPEVPAPRIEHFAFRAENLADFLAHLRELDVADACKLCPALREDYVAGAIVEPNAMSIDVAGLLEAEFRAGEERQCTVIRYDRNTGTCSIQQMSKQEYGYRI